MADGAPVMRVELARALRDAGFTALLTFGLLLPLIGFQTITDFHNNLVLNTRWPLLFAFVASFIPARRAARVNPTEALRAD